jgi:hypothetical protein
MVPALALVALASASPEFPCGHERFADELASRGQLHIEQRACLDAVANAEGPHRVVASQILIEDAVQRGRRGVWKRLVERHLEAIDPEDPVLLMDYARFVFISDRDAHALAFLDQALSTVHGWGDAPASELALHRMRTVVAVQLWERGEGSIEQAHDYAAAWWAASEAFGAPEFTAHSLCVATGDPVDCGEPPTVADASF